MNRRTAVAIVLSTVAVTVGCAHRSATPPQAETVAPAVYEPVSFANVEALSAGQLKGANVELRGKFDRIYNNPYWAKRFPSDQWVQFWLTDDVAQGQAFQNVFIPQSAAAELLDAQQGVVVVVRGTLDHNGTFPYLTAVSANVVR